MKRRIPAILIWLIAGTLAASGCAPATAAPTPTSVPTPAPGSWDIIAEGRLEPAHYAELSLNADGAIDELFAHEGDMVKAGQVIARVKNAQAQDLAAAQARAATRLAEAYQKEKAVQDQLDDFPIPAKFADMPVADAAKLALESLQRARAEFAPYEDDSLHKVRFNKYFATLPRHIVVDSGEYKPGVADELHKTLLSRWHDYRKVLMWMELESQLEQAQAQIDQYQKDYESLMDPDLSESTSGARAALANAELRAPFAGTLTNLDLKAGEFATAGTPVATIADLSSWVVKTTDLTEIDVVNIREGQPVTLNLDALPEATLEGYVLSIGQNYSEQQGDITYEVRILLTDQQPEMRWGMTAQVRFKPQTGP